MGHTPSFDSEIVGMYVWNNHNTVGHLIPAMDQVMVNVSEQWSELDDVLLTTSRYINITLEI